MTNEQLAAFIQQDGGKSDLLPVLWDRVKKVVYMLCDRYYTQYSERFNACGVERRDYRQACYEAFLKALEAFDPDSGNKFTSYLDYHIKNTGAELIGIRNGKRRNNKPLDNCSSLDAPLTRADEGDNFTLGDCIVDETAEQAFEDAMQQIEDEETKAVLSEALERLEDREREVIVREYFEDMTQKQIAELLGLSSERVRQIKAAAMRHLRGNVKLNRLREEQHVESRLHFDSYAYNIAFFEAQKQIKRIIKSGHYLSYGKEQAIIHDCLRRQLIDKACFNEAYNTAFQKLEPYQQRFVEYGRYSFRVKPNGERQLVAQLSDASSGEIITEIILDDPQEQGGQ